MRKLLILLAVLLNGCAPGPPVTSAAAPPVRVELGQCGRHTLAHQVELPGDVHANLQTNLYAKVSGYLDQMLVDRGDTVHTGELLAVVSVPEAHTEAAQARASYAQAQAELRASQARLPRAQADWEASEAEVRKALAQHDQAEADLARAKAAEQQASAEHDLAQANYHRLQNISTEDSGLVAAQDLDVARTSLAVSQEKMRAAHGAVEASQQALAASKEAVASARSKEKSWASQIQIAQAQLSSSTFQGQAQMEAAHKAAEWLDYTEIRAPFNGTVTARNLDPGALVQAADRSAQSQTRPLLTVADYNVVRVRIQLPQDVAGLVHRGTRATVSLDPIVRQASISRTAGALDVATRTMLAEIDVQNHDHVLRPGMSVRVVMDVGNTPNVLAVPASALIIERSRRSVFVDDNGTAKRVVVKTGLENQDWVEVTEGLKGGEQVVLSPPDRLSTGDSLLVTR